MRPAPLFTCLLIAACSDGEITEARPPIGSAQQGASLPTPACGKFVTPVAAGDLIRLDEHFSDGLRGKTLRFIPYVAIGKGPSPESPAYSLVVSDLRMETDRGQR